MGNELNEQAGEFGILNLIIENWSQVVAVIAALGAFLKIATSFYFKIRELRYGISHKGKMESLTRFFSAYAECKRIWNALPLYHIFENKKPFEELEVLYSAKAAKP